jgi:uncharacterized coiled-coil DUF342 family protein
MILRTLIRWTFGIDVIEAVERANLEREIAQEAARRQANWHNTAVEERDAARAESRELSRQRDAFRADARAFWTQRDAARDQVKDLTAELETLRKTNAMFRSLIAILRDCNRELDERNVYLEQLHGMTPGERLAAAENDAPNRCTESKTVTMPLPKADEVQYRVDAWQIHGTSRWGIGVAIDVEWLDRRLSKLEDEACHQ